MGSLRADVNGLVDMWRKVLCTEATLRAVKLTEFKPSSLSYNLLADFSFISALRVISSKPKEARNCLNLAVDNYERAVLHAPNCIETAAAHGAALVALGRLDEAQAVFDRGLSIENPDHPWLHHGIIQISGGAKSDYVADARARITAQSSMLQEEKHCEKIRKMIRRMGRSSDTPPQVLAAVKQLSSDKPFSVRAKILQYELIEITLRQGCNPSVKLDLIHAALEAMQDASSQYCNSLLIAYYHAKQLNTLGWLAAAKDECHRALNIMYPDEPNLHDIPLGFTRGHLHAERVMVWKEKLKQLPERVVGTAKVAVQEMSTDEQGRFVWLKVSDLIDHVGQDTEASAIVKEAVDNYKRGSSWLFWFCPIAEGSSCCEFRTRKSSDILRHITAHIDLDHRLCRDLQCELPHRAVLQLQTDDTDIVLTHDQDGFPIICFASIHKLMESFVTDDKFSFKEFISQKSVSAMIKFEEFVDLVETNSSFDAIKMSWLDFLEASYATYLQYILPLIVSVKWEELKQMFESIDEMNKWDYEFQMDLSQVVNKEDKNKVGKPFQEVHLIFIFYLLLLPASLKHSLLSLNLCLVSVILPDLAN
ncbi:hypothetical protein QOZ80_3AG0240510 [Eleusine coracana subsp. coracana]|nr:hypothetical protein QOZ80_3AG0240510 [Eleusine coracana subsp. coracana]